MHDSFFIIWKHATVLDALKTVAPATPVHSAFPLSMEQVDQASYFLNKLVEAAY